MTPLDVENVLQIRADMIKALTKLETLLIQNGRLNREDRAVMTRAERRKMLQNTQQLDPADYTLYNISDDNSDLWDTL